MPRRPAGVHVKRAGAPAEGAGAAVEGAGAAVEKRGDLVITGLAKTFTGLSALTDVSLTVSTGQVHGLLGRNGAGKSTLLSILLGLATPDRGTVTLADRPLSEIRRQVPGGMSGSVEEPRLYPYLTARRTLDLLAGLDDPGGLDPAEALELVGLSGQAATKVGGFSMGMRARLVIAAGLLRRPRLLVLDEPTSGLDPVTAASLLELLRSLASGGTSVLLSSHDLPAVADVCDRVTILASGRVVLDEAVGALGRLAPPPVFALSTSDDVAALDTAGALSGLDVEVAEAGLLVRATQTDLDRLTAALVGAGVFVRRLDTAVTPLRALFDELTQPSEQGDRPGSEPEGEGRWEMESPAGGERSADGEGAAGQELPPDREVPPYRAGLVSEGSQR